MNIFKIIILKDARSAVSLVILILLISKMCRANSINIFKNIIIKHARSAVSLATLIFVTPYF